MQVSDTRVKRIGKSVKRGKKILQRSVSHEQNLTQKESVLVVLVVHVWLFAREKRLPVIRTRFPLMEHPPPPSSFEENNPFCLLLYEIAHRKLQTTKCAQ